MTGSRTALVYAALVLALSVTGCARRPAITQAAVPPPTAESVSAAPAPAAPAPAPASAAAPIQAPPSPAPAPVDTARPAPKTFASVPSLPDVYFDFDKSAIRSGAEKVLQESAAWLKTNPGHALLIEGHCDERGTEEYNLALGDRRAQAALSFLVAHGVASRRISVVSYGEQRPQCTKQNEECWRLNRRVHFVVKPQ